MIRFYSPDLKELHLLPEEESAHCARVLRMREGDEIQSVDGKGNLYYCRITDANPRKVAVDILSSEAVPDNWAHCLTLAVAPTKNADRMEWLVEKAVEMGINRIVLLKCEHSERKVMKTERLHRIMVSAMKQSLKARLPELEGPVSFKEFMQSTAGDTGCKVMGYCSPTVERRDFGDVYAGRENLTVLIGPEGDFSPEEVRLAMEAGYKPVTFGTSRLRTETAALYAVSAFHVINNLNLKELCTKI